MTNSRNWVEGLKISPEKLNEWSALAPDDLPLLIWCLKEGHIPVDKYLRWAQENYALPVVNSEFFETAFNAEESRTLLSSDGEWTAWRFPLAQWDDVLLIGCVEPPESGESHWRYVLADPHDLEKAWESTGTKQVEEEPEMPVGMSAATSAKPFKLDLNLEGNTENPTLPPAPPLPDAGKSEAIGSGGEEEPESPPILNLTSINEAALILNEEAPPPVAEKPEKKEKPPKVEKAAAKPQLSDKERDKQIEKLFTALQKKYKHCLLMKCVDNKALLYKWDSTLKPKKDVAVDLSFHTFFRIVAKTHLPYHGYLVESPAHQEFFESLQINELPGCVSAIPVKDENGNLVGVLVAFGEASLQNLETLHEAETAANEFLPSLASNLAA